MKLNLNFRDSEIKRLSQHEFEFIFNLSNMNKPRLSPDARVYIEQFNIPEFLDEALGREDGDLKGYFELRCNNIVNDGYDTEMGNRGGAIIFTSPLENYRSYVNNNPMFVNNFKINQNFLDDRLVFNLKVYDRFGNPYDTSPQYVSTLDTTGAEYVTYKTELDKFNVLNTENDNVNNRLTALQSNDQTFKYMRDNSKTRFEKNKTDLYTALTAYSNDHSNALRARILADWVMVYLNVVTINGYKGFFEHNSNIHKTSPYASASIKTLWKSFYPNFIAYYEHEKLVEHNQNQLNELQKSAENLILDYIATFSSTDNIKSERKTVAYDITDASGVTVKDGNIELDFFNSKSQNKSFVSIVDVKQTTGTLEDADVINIPGANFTTSALDEFDYYFAKDGSAQTGIDVSGNVNEIRQKFALRVNRKGSVYTPYFLESEIQSEHFAINDKITVKGEYLGGGGDLVIEVTAIDALLPAEDIIISNYTNPANTSGRDFGEITFTVTKPNDASTRLDADYTLKDENFSNSSNYVIGDQFTILGSALNGIDNTHNADFEVKEIYKDTVHTISDQTSNDTYHSIPEIKVDHSTANVEIYASGNTKLDGTTNPLRPTSFGFKIKSRNGQYTVDLDADIPVTGWAQDFQVKILGSVLTGVDAVNDCLFQTPTVTAGVIDMNAITFNATDQARQPLTTDTGTASGYKSGFVIDVKQKLKSQVYEIDENWKTENWNFAVGDSLFISGADLGGVKGVNDITIQINTTESTPDKNDIVKEANVDAKPAVVIDQNNGAIKRMDISGKGRFIQEKGTITNHAIDATSGSPIDISTLSVPDLEITLTADLWRSSAVVSQELAQQQIEVESKKDALLTTTRVITSRLGSRQADKFKAMNMSMILYDEVPNYTQSSRDALVGNTYSRTTDCQFKRI